MSTTLDHDALIRLAERVETAQRYATPIRKLTGDYPDMTMQDAYRVQTELRRNYERKGERVIGWKDAVMGLSANRTGFACLSV